MLLKPGMFLTGCRTLSYSGTTIVEPVFLQNKIVSISTIH